MKEEAAGQFGDLSYTPGPDGMSLPGAIALWAWSVLNILEELRSELDPVQIRLAQDVIQCWGRVLPYAASATDVPRVVMSAEVQEHSKLFDEAFAVASMARVFREVFAHRDENRERDAGIIAELQAFCDRTTQEMRSTAAVGDLTVEGGVYGTLDWHLRQLMYVALGDRHMRAFITRYDAAMRRIDETARLAGAVKV